MSKEICYDKVFINGDWAPSTSVSKPEYIEVIDANNGKPFAKVLKATKEDAERAIDAAYEAFDAWATTTLDERKGYIKRIIEEYEKREQEIADLLQRELGAPKKFAEEVQVKMFTLHMKTALEIADKITWEEHIKNTWIVKEPIGVVACITPWNWPLNQIACKLAPALLTGCTVVLKPAESTPLNAFILAEVMQAAGLPKGVFNMVCGTGKDIGPVFATHPKVAMISFTGSTDVGRKLHELGASTIKRVHTELGGKSAAIVLPDATKDQIAMMAGHVLTNSGQTCDALSRLLVPRSRYEEACDIAKHVFEEAKVVEATDEAATKDAKGAVLGPLSSEKQFKKVNDYIRLGQEEGARILTGGPGRPDGVCDTGYFVKPTIFVEVNNKMRIAQEEIFGPVLCIITNDNIEEAVEIANDTIYGLNNAVVGQDDTMTKRVALQLKSGRVQVNTLDVQGDAPFGGYKQSGVGREWGRYAVEDFVQIKAINFPKK